MPRVLARNRARKPVEITPEGCASEPVRGALLSVGTSPTSEPVFGKARTRQASRRRRLRPEAQKDTAPHRPGKTWAGIRYRYTELRREPERRSAPRLQGWRRADYGLARGSARCSQS